MSRFRNIVLSTSALLGLLLICPIRSENEEIFEKQDMTTGEILEGLAPIAMDIAADIPFVNSGVMVWNSAEEIYNVIDRTPDPMEVVNTKLDILTQKVDQIENSIIDSRSFVIEKFEDLIAYKRFQDVRDDYLKAVWKVLEAYNQYLRHVANGSIKQNSTRFGLVRSLLDEYPNLDTMLSEAHEILYKKEENLLFTLMQLNSYQQILFMCKTSKSIQQMVYQFYQKLVEAEVKTYVLKLHLISIRDSANAGMNTTAKIGAKRTFEENIDEVTRIIEGPLRILPREVRKCNPRPNHKGTTHVKFGPIFQKYIMNQADQIDFARIRSTPGSLLDRLAYEIRPNLESLTKNRTHSVNFTKIQNSHLTLYDYYRETKMACSGGRLVAGLDHSEEEYACKSYVRGCKLAYDTESYEICPRNKTKDGEERYERYDYIDPRGIFISMFPNRKMEVKAFANKTECVKSDFTPWGAVLLGANDPFGFCPDLLCTCNDLNPKHLRFFDLRWVKADDDKVITGIKITPFNNTFYLQIKQGKLLPYGLVNSKNKWTDINPLHRLFYTDEKLKNKHYMKLTYDQKTFWLGNISAPGSEVITGIRFAPILGNSGIGLEVLSKEFDFRTGNLSKVHNHFRYSIDQSETIDLDGLDMPDNNKYENDEDMDKGNSVMKLTQTDIDLDFGQNILPFVDIQPVETYPPAPLSGVGLFRRSSKGSGGYLALRLLTFDFATTFKHAE